MAKAYWIVRVDVTDAEPYKAYLASVGAALAKFGARFLVRGAAPKVKEGAARERNIVVEFADYATAVACYESPEYQAVLKLRANATLTDLIIIEGYDGPQP
jgi:uncharacterized protein (DUF1330 family)